MAASEYERLTWEQEAFLNDKRPKKIGLSEKKVLPLFPTFHLHEKTADKKEDA